MEQAHKLTEAALAHEEVRKAEDALNLLRTILGTFRYEKDTTVALLEGYVLAMKRITHQADL